VAMATVTASPSVSVAPQLCENISKTQRALSFCLHSRCTAEGQAHLQNSAMAEFQN
jgi:hypothetical protein